MARILYAEDDNQMRAFLTRALIHAGHEVHDFPDGTSARDYFEANKNDVDLILTDIVMPGMDGFELALHVRRARPEIKIMYMTGFSSVGAQGDVAGQVLQKPIHIRDILDQIKALTQA